MAANIERNGGSEFRAAVPSDGSHLVDFNMPFGIDLVSEVIQYHFSCILLVTNKSQMCLVSRRGYVRLCLFIGRLSRNL